MAITQADLLTALRAARDTATDGSVKRRLRQKIREVRGVASDSNDPDFGDEMQELFETLEAQQAFAEATVSESEPDEFDFPTYNQALQGLLQNYGDLPTTGDGVTQAKVQTSVETVQAVERLAHLDKRFTRIGREHFAKADNRETKLQAVLDDLNSATPLTDKTSRQAIRKIERFAEIVEA